MTDNTNIERLNYFTGQFLEADDFKAEQEYHIRMRRFGNRALYSAGILDGGFEVQKMSDSEISISSGIGIDAQGRELIIITPLKVGVPIDKKSMTLNITLEYVEKEVETSSDTFVDAEGISVTGKTRIAETPVVGFHEDANITNNQIKIAKITLDANGKIVTVDNSARQFAHARFLGNVIVGSGESVSKLAINGNNQRQISTTKWADMSANSSGYGLFAGNAYVTYSNNDVHFKYANSHDQIGAIGFAVNYPQWNKASIISSGTTNANQNNDFHPLTIATFTHDGKVGIGTDNPGAKLAIRGELIANKDNDTLSGLYIDLTFNDNNKSGVNHASLAVKGNVALGDYAACKGGMYSTAIGHWAYAMHKSSFIWSSGPWYKKTIPEFKQPPIYEPQFETTTADEQFVIKAFGGVWIRGQANATGGWLGPGTDYAEYFESVNGKSIEIGKTVALDQGKIRVAKKGDIPIGVISANPVILGGSYADWPKKFKRDDYGQVLTESYQEEIMIPDVDCEGKLVDRKTNEFVTKQRPVFNPDYDVSKKYIPRSERPEWNCVGLIGQLPVRKGQVVATNWIKIHEISQEVDLWLIK